MEKAEPGAQETKKIREKKGNCRDTYGKAEGHPEKRHTRKKKSRSGRRTVEGKKNSALQTETREEIDPPEPSTLERPVTEEKRQVVANRKEGSKG